MAHKKAPHKKEMKLEKELKSHEKKDMKREKHMEKEIKQKCK